MPSRARCGIYCILNRVTGDTYIGQARNVAKRWYCHRALLRSGKHHAKKLQASYAAHGEAAFSIRVLEECPAADLNQREFDLMVRLRPSLNSATPDYLRIASRGLPPKPRIGLYKQPGNLEPSRFICGCGQLKSVDSQFCLNCARTMLVKMKADGYLPSDHRPEHPFTRTHCYA